MKTKLLTAAMAALSCLSASGKDVFFFAGNSSLSSKTVKDITSIVIGSDGLLLKKADNTSEKVAYADFTSFAFKSTISTGVEAVEAKSQTKVAVNASGDIVVSASEKISKVEVFAVNGSKVAQYAPESNGFSFTVKGGKMYIVKVMAGKSQQIFKVVK